MAPSGCMGKTVAGINPSRRPSYVELIVAVATGRWDDDDEHVQLGVGGGTRGVRDAGRNDDHVALRDRYRLVVELDLSDAFGDVVVLGGSLVHMLARVADAHVVEPERLVLADAHEVTSH